MIKIDTSPSNALKKQLEFQKGGPGSGNFDHEGIPGHQGGSAPSNMSGKNVYEVSSYLKSNLGELKNLNFEKQPKGWNSGRGESYKAKINDNVVVEIRAKSDRNYFNDKNNLRNEDKTQNVVSITMQVKDPNNPMRNEITDLFFKQTKGESDIAQSKHRKNIEEGKNKFEELFGFRDDLAF